MSFVLSDRIRPYSDIISQLESKQLMPILLSVVFIICSMLLLTFKWQLHALLLLLPLFCFGMIRWSERNKKEAMLDAIKNIPFLVSSIYHFISRRSWGVRVVDPIACNFHLIPIKSTSVPPHPNMTMNSIGN